MRLFHPKKPCPIPPPFTAGDIRVEASICTGERTVGFYDKSSKKLLYAELVRSEEDVDAFYEKYGLHRDSTP